MVRNDMFWIKFWLGFRDLEFKNVSRYKYEIIKDFDFLRKEIRVIELEILNFKVSFRIFVFFNLIISFIDIIWENILKKIEKMDVKMIIFENILLEIK